LGYLWVYPEDLGNFKQQPLSVIENFNAQSPHGRNNWRLPAPDELAVMENNFDAIGLGDDTYMSTIYSNGVLRLVSTGKSVAEQDAERKKILSVEMVSVHGGTFTMGSSSNYNNEKPPHQVTLISYSIGKYPITQAQWVAAMDGNPSSNKGCADCPVENVSWEDAQKFIVKLNELSGKRYRLPTEAEWEYAARGGVKSHGYDYSGSNIIGDVAWYCDNSGKNTHPVGTKSPNELGIYDMNGNVLEWCGDWFSEEYYSSSPLNNPTGPSSGSYRVFRGGGWYNYAPNCRVASRAGYSPSYRGSNVGFRVVHP
jgi:formylglycine-generating enzyme required for sulfatase activity